MKTQADLFGGALTDAPSPKYAAFFAKFPQIKELPVAQWKPLHLLAYFCEKYKAHYDSDYKFKFNTPNPGDCFEIFQIKKLSNTLSSDPTILKPYIDWVFETKVKEAKRKLTSIAFLSHEDVTFNYKKNVLWATKEVETKRTDKLPPTILELFPHLSTYGDLAFLSQLSPMPEEISQSFAKLSTFFDLSLLKKIT